jgi:diguanylate cyclase (GGDEF)-like protein/PAS domain S-box-containing protein
MKTKENQNNSRELQEQISSLRDRISELEQELACRKETEETLRREYVLKSNMVEHNPAFFVAIDGQGIVRLMNGSMLDALGYTFEEVTGKSYLSTFVPPGDRAALSQVFSALIKQAGPTINQNRVLTKDGRELLVEWRGRCVVKPDGNLDYFFGTGIDITLQKRTEEALYDSEVKYRSLFDSAVEGIFQTTPDGRFVSVNPALAKIFGYESPDELMTGMTDIAKQHYVHAGDRDAFKSTLEANGVIRGFETQLRGRDGNIVWASLNARAVRNTPGDIVCYEGILEDITDRKRAEKKLKESEETLTSLINATDETLMLIDIQGKIVMANECAAQRFEKTAGQLIGVCLYDILPPDLASLRRKEFNEVFRTGMQKVFIDERGGRTYESFAHPVLDDKEKVSKISIFAKDITNRRKTEQSLIESEDKFRSLAEKSIVGIYLLQDNVYRYANERLAELTGYSIPEMVDVMGPEDIIHPDDRPMMEENIRRRISGEIQSLQSEFRIITKSGEVRNIEVYSSRAMYRGRPSVMGTLLDVTERKKAEANLQYFSIHDSLTGLYNRFFFEEELRRLGSGRFDPVGIVMCDLDGLKLVNDTLGHARGDYQLIAAARLLKDQFRSSDVVARIGGDEFAVLLPHCSKQVLYDVRKRIEEALKDQFIPNTTIPLMMSTGYALGNGKGSPIEDLLKAADANMYDEKARHREMLKKYFTNAGGRQMTVYP